MKKITLTLIAFSFVVGGVFAQDTAAVDTTWRFSGFFQQNLNQVNFTNWAAGGENSFSSTSNARINANYSQGKVSWENYLDMSYGIVKLEDSPTRKNTDKIDLFSKFGREINQHLNYSSIFNFQSQFDKGYNPSDPNEVVSRFMAPGYLTVAIGLDYKPVEFISIFLSPATGKFTFVMDDALAAQGAYGVEEGENVNPEFGALLRLEFEKEVVTNVNVNSRIILFNNYTDSEVSNRKNTDVDWIIGINMPVNKYITATVGLHLLYDHDIDIEKDQMINGEPVVGPATQFKQQFGLGLAYNFQAIR